ncbi:MAG TPA: P-loop NTPase fold protein [Longimicrobium sp.]|nr:P-loop NTPase fold protein [Longimicrobium sp.]
MASLVAAGAGTGSEPIFTADLLMGFALAARRWEGDAGWAGAWVATILEFEGDGKLSEYLTAFSHGTTPPDEIRALSRGVAEALDRAGEISRATSGNARIHARHLVAALLTDPRPADHSAVASLLSRHGIDVADLRQRFFEWVRPGPDNEDAWAEVLVPQPAETPPPLPPFDADAGHGARDFLGIRRDVRAFAGLIAARTVGPPLSIGLFGEWGSGKTFFMRMLQKEVERLACEADSSGAMQRDLTFYKRIVQIEFNAWHYSDGNLWASLVQHILDNLRVAGEPARSISQELQEHVLTQLGATRQAAREAEREVVQAEAQVTTAQGELKTAETRFRTESERLAALTAENFLGDVPLEDVKNAINPTLKALGLVQAAGGALALRTALGEARTLLTRGHGVLAPLLYGEDDQRRRRWRGLLAALLAGPVLAAVAAAALWLAEVPGLTGVGAMIGGAAGLLGSVAKWLQGQLTWVGEHVKAVEAAQRKVDEKIARKQAENLAEVRKAQEQLRLHEADYLAAKRKEEQAQQRVAEAQARVENASLTPLLTSFIEERANSTDYRKHLGVLAMVRNDFEKLSDYIEEENWRLCPPVSGEDQAGRSLAKYATYEDEEWDAFDVKRPEAWRPSRTRKRINRIVLYIDDLDRCPPAKVVEVLQAVHLLLAFPLFVVVVGVDARWITRSLAARYRELLASGSRSDGQPHPGDEAARAEFEELFGKATTHDYLEKIFQVPFWLAPMTDGAARDMVRGLLETSLVPDPVTNTGDGKPAPKIGGGTGDGTAGGPDQGGITGGAGRMNAPIGKGFSSVKDFDPADFYGQGEPGDEDVPAKAAISSKAAEPEDDDADLPTGLEVYDSELKFMEELAPLLGRSPRALKRFVNVYRLIKASLKPYERRGFAGTGKELADYQAVLFLLAVDTGAPAVAPALFRALRARAAAGQEGSDTVTLGDIEDTVEREPELQAAQQEWRRVRDWLRARATVDKDGSGGLTPSDLRRAARWVPRVGRFSFHTGRVTELAPLPGEPESEAEGAAVPAMA